MKMPFSKKRTLLITSTALITGALCEINAIYLSPKLTQSSAKNLLEKFCNETKTKMICNDYRDQNTTLIGAARDDLDFFSALMPSLYSLAIGVLIAAMMSLLSLLNPKYNSKGEAEEGERRCGKLATSLITLVFTSLSSLVAMFFPFFISSQSTISVIKDQICPDSKNMTQSCNTTFSNINNTSITGIENLIDNVSHIPFNSLLLSISLGITAFHAISLSSISLADDPRFFCKKGRSVSNNQEKGVLLEEEKTDYGATG